MLVRCQVLLAWSVMPRALDSTGARCWPWRWTPTLGARRYLALGTATVKISTNIITDRDATQVCEERCMYARFYIGSSMGQFTVCPELNRPLKFIKAWRTLVPPFILSDSGAKFPNREFRSAAWHKMWTNLRRRKRSYGIRILYSSQGMLHEIFSNVLY